MSNIFIYIISFSLFLCMPPYFVWHTLVVPIVSIVIAGCVIIDRFVHIDSKINGLSIIFCILYLFVIFNSNSNIWGLLIIISLIPLFFIRGCDIVCIYDYFKKIYALSLSISLIVYFLVTFCGVGIPYAVIPPLNDGKELTCISYPFLVSELSIGGSYRFFGMFDEPGVVGTFSAIILLVEKFNFKDKYNIPILIGGIFSLSLYFFAICIIYIFLFSKLYLKIFIILCSTLFVYLMYDNEVLYTLLFRRFIFEDGKFLGDTRVHGDFDIFYDHFKQTNAFYYGLGAGKGALYNEGGCSYKQVIVDYGIVFFIIYCVTFIIKAFKLIGSNIRQLFIYILLLFSVLYHRPYILNPSYVFLLFAGAYLVPYYYKNTKS